MHLAHCSQHRMLKAGEPRRLPISPATKTALGGSRTFTTPPVEGASGVVAVRPISNDRHSSATRTTSTAERRGGAASLLEHRIFWIGRSVDSVLAGCRAQTPCSEGAHSNIHIPAQAQQLRTTHHAHTPRPHYPHNHDHAHAAIRLKIVENPPTDDPGYRVDNRGHGAMLSSSTYTRRAACRQG